jgi:hypothetical protein
LEYCAAGLGVVSNSYQWVREFATERDAVFLWLDRLNVREDFEQAAFRVPDVSDLEWDIVLDKAGLLPFVQTLYEVVSI